jgi:hypothetical protein
MAAKKRTIKKKVKTGDGPRRIKSDPRKQKEAHHLRAIKLGQGMPAISKMREEIQDMTDVLLGRVPPPIDYGILTLQETADAYFARASEMTMLLQEREAEGIITKGSMPYRFRTGELRTFMEMAKRAADLGSRRLSKEEFEFKKATYGRDSAGGF